MPKGQEPVGIVAELKWRVPITHLEGPWSLDPFKYTYLETLRHLQRQMKSSEAYGKDEKTNYREGVGLISMPEVRSQLMAP